MSACATSVTVPSFAFQPSVNTITCQASVLENVCQTFYCIRKNTAYPLHKIVQSVFVVHPYLIQLCMYLTEMSTQCLPSTRCWLHQLVSKTSSSLVVWWCDVYHPSTFVSIFLIWSTAVILSISVSSCFALCSFLATEYFCSKWWFQSSIVV